VALYDAVVQMVAESAGLGYFGCAAGDEPGFVAMPQPVECQPWPDGVRADVRAGVVVVAVDGGVEHTADWCAPMILETGLVGCRLLRRPCGVCGRTCPRM